MRMLRFFLSFSCVYVLRDQILSVGHHLSPSKPQQKKRPRFISDENDGFPKPTSLSATNQEERNNRSQTIFLSLIFQYAISGKDSGNFLIRIFQNSVLLMLEFIGYITVGSISQWILPFAFGVKSSSGVKNPFLKFWAYFYTFHTHFSERCPLCVSLFGEFRCRTLGTTGV